MQTFKESKRQRVLSGRAGYFAFLALGLLAIAVTGCVSDEDKCGDDMELADVPGFGKYCVPKVVPMDTSSPGTDTGMPVPDASVPDAGDASVDTGAAPPCTANADCGEGFYCDRTFTPAECLPNPTGQGQPCASDADCAGFDADYCEAMVSGTCLVRDCDPVISNCSEGYHCCDFAEWGLPSLCIDAALSGGVCS